MDRISPNFIYAFDLLQKLVSDPFLEKKWTDFDKTLLTRSTLGLLAVSFRKLVREFWPLIDVRIMLPLNILRHSGLLLHARHCSGAKSDCLTILVCLGSYCLHI